MISDEILGRVGGYVLGNALTSVIIGAGTSAWMLALGIPYPILLGLFVALIDLIPSSAPTSAAPRSLSPR